MEAGRNLQLVACLPMAPQYPGLLEAIGPMLDVWRATELEGRAISAIVNPASS
jgi:hypothetical protein